VEQHDAQDEGEQEDVAADSVGDEDACGAPRAGVDCDELLGERGGDREEGEADEGVREVEEGGD